MVLFLDTTALIDLWKDDPALREVLSAAGTQLATTMLNYQEVVFGLDSTNPKHDREREFYKKLLSDVTLLEQTPEAVDMAAGEFADVEGGGRDQRISREFVGWVTQETFDKCIGVEE